MKAIRIIVLATGNFALPSLRACVNAGFVPKLFVTRPARKRGRGMHLRSHEISRLAQDFQIETVTPERLTLDFLRTKMTTPPDLILVIAYGQILSNDVLSWPKYGCFNIHASLLPRWRGADPIRHALLANDKETGVTLQRITKVVDAGAIVRQARIRIEARDHYTSLHATLAEKGADLVIAMLENFPVIQTRDQDETQVTLAPKLSRETCVLSDSLSMDETLGRIQAFAEKPGATITHKELRLSILMAERASKDVPFPETERLLIHHRQAYLRCRDGAIKVLQVRPAGRGKMSSADFINGYGRFLRS